MLTLRAPIDPQKSSDDVFGWFVSHGWQIVSAIILTFVVVALFRSVPKWILLAITLIVIAVYVGVRV